jgi:hypothetical protein
MPRIIENEEYLSLEEATARFEWKSSTLYYFRSLGLLNSYKFLADKRVFWRVSDLEAIKNRPPEVSKPGPKGSGLLVVNPAVVNQ